MPILHFILSFGGGKRPQLCSEHVHRDNRPNAVTRFDESAPFVFSAAELLSLPNPIRPLRLQNPHESIRAGLALQGQDASYQHISPGASQENRTFVIGLPFQGRHDEDEALEGIQ